MLKKLVKESLVVLCGTLFFLALAATVGIPGNERAPAPAVAASEPTAPAGVSPEVFRASRLPEMSGGFGGVCLAGGHDFLILLFCHEQ